MDVAKVKQNLEIYLEKIKSGFPNYEDRPEQYAMIRTILNGLYQEKHVMIEAGTGTGKSLAYLLGVLAVMMSEDKKMRAVIVTHTINLQEQLLNKDIPIIQQLLGDTADFRAELAKGRGNYLCLRKFYNAMSSQQGIFESAEQALNFREVISKVYDGKGVTLGDLSDLDIAVLPGVWMEINSNNDTCIEGSCSYGHNCFFRKARQELQKADLIITNHALYMVDLVIRGNSENEEGILPPYDYVVIDEAHHLENSATDAFSIRINRRNLMQVGAWAQSMLKKEDVRATAVELGMLREFTTAAQNYYNYVGLFLKALEGLAEEAISKRVYPKTLETLENPLAEPLKHLEGLVNTLEENASLEEETAAEIAKLGNKLRTTAHEVDFVVNTKGEDYVYWLERVKDIEAIAAPLDVADLLSESLFSKSIPVVCTSATLAVPTMTFMAQRLGVENSYNKVIHSPFDYQKKAGLIIPNNALVPEYEKMEDYEEYLCKLLQEVVIRIKGGIFVLFTSYRLLDNVYDNFCKQDHDRVLLRQGELPRHELLRIFKAEGDGILFGTSSFWEGVDVVGSALRCVVITKLPFAVPDDPLTEARMERLKDQGHNPFMNYMLPQAVLRFKQGFGRLIRSKRDSGVVVVADRRILTKRYGKEFISSLPPIPLLNTVEDVSAE